MEGEGSGFTCLLSTGGASPHCLTVQVGSTEGERAQISKSLKQQEGNIPTSISVVYLMKTVFFILGRNSQDPRDQQSVGPGNWEEFLLFELGSPILSILIQHNIGFLLAFPLSIFIFIFSNIESPSFQHHRYIYSFGQSYNTQKVFLEFQHPYHCEKQL